MHRYSCINVRIQYWDRGLKKRDQINQFLLRLFIFDCFIYESLKA